MYFDNGIYYAKCLDSKDSFANQIGITEYIVVKLFKRISEEEFFLECLNS